MKSNRLLLCSFLILLSCSVAAQKQPLKIGMDAGLSLVSLRGNPVLDTAKKNTTGVCIGLSFEAAFSSSISVRSGIFFQQKGTGFKDRPAYDNNGNIIGNSKVHSTFSYIIVPVLLRTYFGDRIKFFINSGPYFGYLLQQKGFAETAGQPSITINNLPNDKRFDFGLSAGLGVDIPVADQLAFSFEVRSNTGLINVSKVPVANNGSIKTSALDFLLGLSYNLRGK